MTRGHHAWAPDRIATTTVRITTTVLVLVTFRVILAIALSLVTIGPSCLAGNTPAGRGDGEVSLLIRGDGSYENAIAWQFEGVVPPDLGAFAVRYPEALESTISGVILDLTTGPPPPTTRAEIGSTIDLSSPGSGAAGVGESDLDLYVWDESEGVPGAVLWTEQVRVSIDGTWPQFTRVDSPIDPPLGCQVITGEAVWVGFWGPWPGEAASVFVGVDQDGFGPAGMTRIAPDLGFPDGWQDVSVAWSGVSALGIGILAEPCGMEPVLNSTWGAIKRLYGQ